MLSESNFKWKVRIRRFSYLVAMVITQKIDLNRIKRKLVISSLVSKETQGIQQIDAFRT